MATVQTRYFGAVSPDAGLVIEFPVGLPAFEQERRFLAIEHPRTSPMVLLQSMSTPELCFLTLPVCAVDSAYELQMSADDLSVLNPAGSVQTTQRGDIAVLALVVIGRDGQIRANLMSPIVVNRETRRAVQAVRWDGVYAHDQLVARLTDTAGALERSCS